MVRRRASSLTTATALAGVLMLTACGSVGETSGADGAADDDGGSAEFEIGLVPKVEGISWFQRMEEGVQDFDEEHDDVNAFQIGPDTEDAAKQVAVIEDLIAQNVDAIVVVPNDPQAVAPVLERARNNGIVVVTHEAPTLAGTESTDFDVEAFSNEDFGEEMFAPLAEAMGGQGQLVGEVGSLTSETHMAWYNAGLDYLEANYPDIEIVSDQPYEDNNSDATARSNAQEILRAYPDLDGFVGTSVSALSNFAAILEEQDNTDVAASGLSLPSIAGPYLDDGWMVHAQTWDPAGAGYVACYVALQLLNGDDITTGDDLGYEGYEDVTVDGGIISGNATMLLEAGQFDDGDYPF